MSLDGEILSVEDVEKALTEIENKYSPAKSSKRKDCFEETLTVLSKEFDSLGLPAIELSQPITKIFKQVVSNARSLVHIHRKTLSRIKDVNIDNRYKDTKSAELCKIIDECKLTLSNCEERNSILQNKIVKLQDDNKEMLKRETMLKNELKNTKRYYLSKQDELHCHLKNLTRENQHLRELFRKDLGTNTSKDDATLKLLRKYKTNEEIFKNTIRTLQENNRDLLNEVLDLKKEHQIALQDNKLECAT